MKKNSLFFVFLLMSAVSFSSAAQDPWSERGDVNLDGNVNITDVTALIDYLLNGTWPDVANDYEFVDLGLPSGTKWAVANVGATQPHEFGLYFAWGEIEPKESYTWANYKWCHNGAYNEMTRYCIDENFGYQQFVDNRKVLLMSDDAAFKNMNLNWRMPTYDQVLELINECNWVWSSLEGVPGYEVTNPNVPGKSLFLPAAGYMIGDEVRGLGEIGNYWTRTLYPEVNANAYDLEFVMPGYQFPIPGLDWEKRYYWEERFFGYPVRAVYNR